MKNPGLDARNGLEHMNIHRVFMDYIRATR